jgi:hypothetical protein
MLTDFLPRSFQHPAACEVRALACGKRPLGQRMSVPDREGRLNENEALAEHWAMKRTNGRGIRLQLLTQEASATAYGSISGKRLCAAYGPLMCGLWYFAL